MHPRNKLRESGNAAACFLLRKEVINPLACPGKKTGESQCPCPLEGSQSGINTAESTTVALAFLSVPFELRGCGLSAWALQVVYTAA